METEIWGMEWGLGKEEGGETMAEILNSKEK